MVAPSLSAFVVHSLLDDDPRAVVRHYKPSKIEIEPVLNGSTVDVGHQSAWPLTPVFSPTTVSSEGFSWIVRRDRLKHKCQLRGRAASNHASMRR